MNTRSVVVLLAAVLIVSSVSGCGASQTSSSGEVIQKAQTMQTVEEQTRYLVGQAKSLYNSKEFQSAVDVAQYVLRNLDKDSAEARSLIEDAKKALIEVGQKAAKDAKAKPGF